MLQIKDNLVSEGMCVCFRWHL